MSTYEFKISPRGLERMEEAGDGVCLICGEIAPGIHPLDQNMMCGGCGEQMVFGPDIIAQQHGNRVEEESHESQ